MIIPSKQVLLVSASDKKEVLLFDPQTACVLQTYTTQSGLASTAAYFPLAQQFLIPHLNNTYINIWDSDSQQARKFSVGQGQKVTFISIQEGNILFVGSAQGNFSLYQLPSGILIKRVQLHSFSSEIRNMFFLRQMGYMISSTKKELKLWSLKDIISSEQKPLPQKTIQIASEIISVQLVRGILCVISQRGTQFYYSHNFSLFSLNKQLLTITNPSCSCSSESSLFIGDYSGRIRQIPIDAHEKQLLFEQRKGKIYLQIKKGIQIQTKDSITALNYIDSLNYLVSGNCKGEVKVWHGSVLKNSVQLFKSSIGLLFRMERPKKEKKIGQNLKIKSLHKQEQTKIEQPIICWPSSDKVGIQKEDCSKEMYLDRILAHLNDPSQQLVTQNERMAKDIRELTEVNLKYCRMLQQESEGI